MGCSTTEHRLNKDIWSTGSTSVAGFIPFLRLAVNEAPRVKMALHLTDATLELIVSRAWRYSNDGTSWTTPEAFGPEGWVPVGDWSYGNTYVSVHDSYQWIEIGVRTLNAAETGAESGVVEALITLREDPLASFGAVPTTWGTLEHGLTRTALANKYVYDGVVAPDGYGDCYDGPSEPWSFAAVAATEGDPSGPGCGTYSVPYWIGYDAATRKWGVYTDTGWYNWSISTVGSQLEGSEHAIARVSVASNVATFEVSFDGLRWNTLHTVNAAMPYRCTIVRADAIYTVQRESRS